MTYTLKNLAGPPKRVYGPSYAFPIAVVGSVFLLFDWGIYSFALLCLSVIPGAVVNSSRPTKLWDRRSTVYWGAGVVASLGTAAALIAGNIMVVDRLPMIICVALIWSHVFIIVLLTTSAKAYIWRSFYFFEKNNAHRALLCADEVLNIRPQDPLGSYARALALSKLGNHEESINALTGAMRHLPDDTTLLEVRCRVYTSKGEFDLALADNSSALKIEPENAGLLVVRGKINEAAGNTRAAIDAYLEAIKIDQENFDARLNISRIRATSHEDNQRNGEIALEMSTRLCEETNWEDWISLSVVAAAHAELGQYDEAVKFAQKSMELAPVDEKSLRQERLDLYKSRKPLRV